MLPVLVPRFGYEGVVFIPGGFEGGQVCLCLFGGGGLVNRFEIRGDSSGNVPTLVEIEEAPM